MFGRFSGLLGRGAASAPGFIRNYSSVNTYDIASALAAAAAGSVTPRDQMNRVDISADMPKFVQDVINITSQGNIPEDVDLVPDGHGNGVTGGRPGTMTIEQRNELYELLFKQDTFLERKVQSYYQNTGDSIVQDGHFHIYGSAINVDEPSLNDDGLRAIEEMAYGNIMRKMVGTMGIGAQELTPQQAAMKASIARPFHRVENGYDIGAGLDPIASQQYAVSQWKAEASVNGANFFLGRGSMVEGCTPSGWIDLYTTASGFKVGALPLQTAGLAHPLEGSALHILGVHPNGFMATYVIGAGKHPWLLVDHMNQPVAGSMWSVRNDILELTLNNDVTLKQAMGKAGFEDAQVFMKDYWNWVRETDRGKYNRTMVLSAFDQLSPFMVGYSKSEESLLGYIANKTVTEEDIVGWIDAIENNGNPPELFEGPNDQQEADKTFGVPKDELLVAQSDDHYFYSTPPQTDCLQAGVKMASHLNVVKGELGQALSQVDNTQGTLFLQNLGNPADVEIAKQKLAEGHSAVLCHPTKQTLNCICAALDMPVPQRADMIEMIGFSGTACITSFKPVDAPPPPTTFDGPVKSRALQASVQTQPETETGRAQARIEGLLKGLTSCNEHNSRVGSIRDTGVALDAAAGGGPSDIWGMANMNLGGNYQHYNFKLDSDDSKTVQCSFLTNLWGAGMNLWANPDGPPAQQEGTDWYLIMASCEFSPSKAWSPSADGLLKGWLAYEYVLGLVAQDYPVQTPGPDTLQMISSAPDSSAPSPETKTISSGESTSVNGSIGFFGSTLTGTIGIGHSWSMSHGTSFQVSFCDLQNSSMDDESGANGKWSYTFNDFNSQDEPSNYEINLFQPSGALVWRMPEKYRKEGTKKFTIQIQFGATFHNWYYNDDWYKESLRVGTSSDDPESGMASVAITYPLTQKQLEEKEKEQEGWVTTTQVAEIWLSDGLNPITDSGDSLPAKTEIREIIQAVSQVGPSQAQKTFWKVRCKEQSVRAGDFYIPIEQAPLPPKGPST